VRVEIRDCNGQAYSITSADPRIIGDWFAEHAEMLMSANTTMMPYPMYIWPQTEREQKILSGPDRLQMIEVRLTQDGLLHLAGRILEASKMLGDLENAEQLGGQVSRDTLGKVAGGARAR